MDQSKVMSLVGMKIIGQHGRAVGVISDMFADVETWQLQSLEVKLNRETLDDLKLKRPWFGTQTVHVPVSEISGATRQSCSQTSFGRDGVFRRKAGRGRPSRCGGHARRDKHTRRPFRINTLTRIACCR